VNKHTFEKISMTHAIAQFGFGKLGMAIVQRLLGKGYVVNAWNRSPETLIELAEQGVIVKASPAKTITSSDILISVLPDPAALQEVLFDQDWAHDLAGRCIIHFGSVNPARSQAILDAFNAHQAGYVEVAALGSVHDMERGTMQLLIGASDADYQRANAILQDLSDQVIHIGEVGTAVTIKLATQQLLASLFCAFCTSLSLVKEKGLSIDMFMDYIRYTSLYAPLFDQKLPRILGRDYSHATLPGKHLERDLKLFLEEAEEIGLNTHAVASVTELLNFSIARGMYEQDFTAVYDIINPPKDES